MSRLGRSTLHRYINERQPCHEKETLQQGSVTQLPSPGLFHDHQRGWADVARDMKYENLLEVIYSAADVGPQEVGNKCCRGVCGINVWWCLTPVCVLQIQSSMSMKFKMSRARSWASRCWYALGQSIHWSQILGMLRSWHGCCSMLPAETISISALWWSVKNNHWRSTRFPSSRDLT